MLELQNPKKRSKLIKLLEIFLVKMADIYSYSLMELNADFSYFSDQNYARILEEFGVHLLH